MPRISQLTTEQPGSTSDIPLNVGSTTRRANVGQIVGAIYTSQGQMTYAASSGNSTFLNPPTSGAVLTYSSGSSIPAWSIPSAGGNILVATSAVVPAWLAAPTSGAMLGYTTGQGRAEWLISRIGGIFIGNAAGIPSVLSGATSGAILSYSSASSEPSWSIPTSGAVLVASSVGVPTWRALGTSGQILQSTGGSPAWVDAGTTVGWELRRESSQATVTTGTTSMNWLTEDYDSDAFHSTSVNSSIVTITIAGTYIMTASLLFGSSGSSMYMGINEGTSILVHQSITADPFPRVSVSVVKRYATTGTVISVTIETPVAQTVFGSTGANQQTRFSGWRIGP